MKVEESRCTGHCCKDFDFKVPPEQFARWVKMRKIGKKPTKDTGRYLTIMDSEEIPQIAEMLIFKRVDQQSAQTRKSVKKSAWSRSYHYTCKHYDKKNGVCLNYANRPNMCRNYPDSGTCEYKGCTLKKDGSAPCRLS